jgi:hypothetical protein
VPTASAASTTPRLERGRAQASACGPSVLREGASRRSIRAVCGERFDGRRDKGEHRDGRLGERQARHGGQEGADSAASCARAASLLRSLPGRHKCGCLVAAGSVIHVMSLMRMTGWAHVVVRMRVHAASHLCTGQPTPVVIRATKGHGRRRSPLHRNRQHQQANQEQPDKRRHEQSLPYAKVASGAGCSRRVLGGAWRVRCHRP